MKTLQDLKRDFQPSDSCHYQSAIPLFRYYEDLKDGFTVTDFEIHVDHDGFDEYGPESDMMTVIVTITSKKETRKHTWYWEEWYNGSSEKAVMTGDKRLRKT